MENLFERICRKKLCFHLKGKLFNTRKPNLSEALPVISYEQITSKCLSLINYSQIIGLTY